MGHHALVSCGAAAAKACQHGSNRTPERPDRSARVVEIRLARARRLKAKGLRRRCAPARGSASRRSPEYLNKEIVLFWEFTRAAIRDYGTGAAMTVKEMGPAVHPRRPLSCS